jgi:guanylate kinase
MAKKAKEPREIEVIVINGPTGVGKSHLAMEMAAGDPKGYYMLCSTSHKSTLRV